MLVFDRPKQGPSHHRRAERVEPPLAVEAVRLAVAARLHLEAVARLLLVNEK